LDTEQTLQSGDKPTAKRQKLQVVHHNKYRAIEAKIKTGTKYTHGALTLVLIDSTLQTHRANKRAAAFVGLTVGAEPKPATTFHNAGEISPPSPPVKEESPTEPASATTPDTALTK
jgi:hypothetical protein